MTWIAPTVESEQAPLPFPSAMRAVARCAATSARLLAERKVRQPTDHVGDVLCFADGTCGRVYRETVVPTARGDKPCGLIVEFRLRWVRGRVTHALFRVESLLNTPLFVGYPGFVSKLWVAHDQRNVYRGVYEWDDPERAHAYARALWWVLALVSERHSIHYAVVPGWTRAELLDGGMGGDGDWWRVTRVTGVHDQAA